MEDAIESREHMCSLCNASYSSYVLGADYMLLGAACTDSTVCMARYGLRAAFAWLCKSKAIENHVLCHATIVNSAQAKQ